MGKFYKIYVIAPANQTTGGIELSHQLVDHLRNIGENAYIVYVNRENSIIKNETKVTPAYAKYNIQVSVDIEDNVGNILILPEIYFDFMYIYKNISIGCWWMSVDNRYNYISYPEYVKHQKGLIRKAKTFLSHYLLGNYNNYKNSTKDLIRFDSRITHLYQSFYAYNHLQELGFSNIAPLSDFINLDFVDNNETEKENLILYNPAKGFNYTKKIIDKMPGYNFIALRGLNRFQLLDYFRRSKLYIDFGEFPGKDRLPREAVINGCCVITGRFGASNFYQDVPISDEYKFSIKSNAYTQIVDKIIYVLNNYERCRPDFDHYRSIIKKEQSIFYKEIDDFFLVSSTLNTINRGNGK